jgi:hypothetical protein
MVNGFTMVCFRVGLGFLWGWFMVVLGCIRVYLGLVVGLKVSAGFPHGLFWDIFRVDLVLVWGLFRVGLGF